jgi:hypothetical protein
MPPGTQDPYRRSRLEAMEEIALKLAYHRTPVGADAWMRPFGQQTLDDFQLAVAAAEAWEFLGLIRIEEIHEEAQTGRRLIDGVRIRRLA